MKDIFCGCPAYFEHTSNIWGISHLVCLPLAPKVDIWNLPSQASFTARAHRCDRGSDQPSEIYERLQFERKKWEKQGISWNIFWQGRDVRQIYTWVLEVIGTEVQKSVAAGVMTVSSGNGNKKLHCSWLYTFQA